MAATPTMSTPTFTHPRRTTRSSSPPATLGLDGPVLNTAMALRKGATFHSPTSPSTDVSFLAPSLPRRSETTLEDVVDAHLRRVALRLDDIDRGLSATNPSSASLSDATHSFRDDSLPVPRGFLDHTVGRNNIYEMASLKKELTDLSIGKSSLRSHQPRRSSHAHASDSGLGSSIYSEKEKNAAASAGTSESAKSKPSASAITRSAAARSTMSPQGRLSARASHRITEHILRPLLAKPSLKDFRPIVRDCPRRIQQREIVCLRDLEKTLIFMAPVSPVPQPNSAEVIAHQLSRYVKERAKSVDLYVDFCLTSIQCIQATVEFLSDREQTRPHDRPYTNGYFVDLVDQIRQYAQQVQDTKEKAEKGESLTDMDAQSTDEVKLYGGIARNGRPPQLVRVKNGKAFSLATGEPIEDYEDDFKGAFQMKRAWSQTSEDDEDIMRSMARRKRNATAEELAPKVCREPGCGKEFKRPCDLTKHEKTHSRPWKCPHKDCKFHGQGWPTEKELGRHINDKHSTAPKYFSCLFEPCPYKSKRESNCKQHMEKSHGWTYVRSKNNGKNRPKGETAPQSSMHTSSPESAGVPPTPEVLDAEMANIFDPAHSLFGDDSSYAIKEEKTNMWDTTQQLPLDLGFSPTSTDLSATPDFASSNTSPFMNMGMATFTDNQNFNTMTDFDLFGNEDLYSAAVQIPSHNPAIFQHGLGQQFGTDLNLGLDTVPQLSPAAHSNAMLFTPSSNNTDDFDETADILMGDDFTLYPPAPTHNQMGALFGEVPNSLANFGTAQDFMQQFYAANTGMEWADDAFTA